MRRITSYRPSPAMVVAFIALLLALGSGAYAQLRIPRNSVGTAQLKANSVTSPKVRAGSLLRSDFRAGQLPRGPAGPAGERGLTGATGATGAVGPIGPRGPAGATNVTVATSATEVNPVATCPAGSVAVGGGGQVAADPGNPVPDPTWYLFESYPVDPGPGRAPTQWTVGASDTGAPGTLQPATAYVVCAAP
jgi:hypothetical protein